MVQSTLDPPSDAARRRRRRRWIVAWSLPGWVALAVFALMGVLQSAHVELSSDAWLLLTMPIGLAGVASWAFAPFLFLIALWLLLRDPWRRERPRAERIGLRLFVLGSPVAWFVSNGIADAYHLLR